jgi:hypothetical protein
VRGDVAAVRREKSWFFHSTPLPCVLLIDWIDSYIFQPTKYLTAVYLDPSVIMTMPNENNSPDFKTVSLPIFDCWLNRTARKNPLKIE